MGIQASKVKIILKTRDSKGEKINTSTNVDAVLHALLEDREKMNVFVTGLATRVGQLEERIKELESKK